jgi:hypothetical protein
MGLDFMELMLSVEEAFRFRFPDTDLTSLNTPGRLIDYLAAHLPAGTEDVCLSQRTFYRLRQSLIHHLGSARSAVRPATSLWKLIPIERRRKVWPAVRRDLGASAAKHWPRLAKLRQADMSEVRDVVRFLVARLPWVKGPEAGWTRRQITEVVQGLIAEVLGLEWHECDEDFPWDKLGIV